MLQSKAHRGYRGLLLAGALLVQADSVGAEAPDTRGANYQAPGLVDIHVTPAPKDMVQDLDVPVTMRDGKKLYVNIYRPAGPGPFPVLVSMSWYGKDRFGDAKYRAWAKRTGYDIGHLTISDRTPFEAPDPAFWTKHGYVVIHADLRGTFKSEGNVGIFTEQEAQDYYDLIEWGGHQPWSTGKVGTTGVSFLAFSQWPAAALHPPSLKAMNPWEGLSDHYRDNAFQGGIPETRFRVVDYSTGLDAIRNKNYGVAFDYTKVLKEHPLFDSWWEPKRYALERITVPALIGASWSNQGNHTRGSFEGFKRIASTEKWLYVHSQYEWPGYYNPDAEALQLSFFDHFLKDKQAPVAQVSSVRLELRKTRSDFETVYTSSWPVPGTSYRKLYLQASHGQLIDEPIATPGVVTYQADGDGSATYRYKFSRDTTLAGNMRLHLWVSIERGDDMDIFVGVRKRDARGNEVPFIGFGGNPNDIVTRGWLRVSARELDPKRSTPSQPYLLHRRSLKLVPGEIVPADVEILPSGTIFEKGSTLELTIQGKDVIDNDVLRHDLKVNQGQQSIHGGGKYDSYLVIPDATKVRWRRQ